MRKRFDFLANRQRSEYRFTSRGIGNHQGESAVDRQRIIPGFDQDAFTERTVDLVGLGGLGGEVGSTIVKGALARYIRGFDPDIANTSDLSRQKLTEADLGDHKARSVPSNLIKEAVAPLEIVGYPLRFQTAVARGMDLRCDAAFVAVDNSPARTAASIFFRKERIPLVVLALSPGADMGYVLVQDKVQDKDGPCYGCLHPDEVNDTTTHACVPASGDIVKTVAGIAVYAYTTLFSQRARHWNYFEVNLCGPVAGRTAWIPRRSTCPLCG